MTGSEYQLFVTEAETRVQAAFSAEASRFGAAMAGSANISVAPPVALYSSAYRFACYQVSL